MFDFEIKIAQTDEEIKAAQRLRYEVFYTEAGAESSSMQQGDGLDSDKFDSVSKHLIVVDKSRNMIVGTYRLLFSAAVNQIGFYSEHIFDIQNIKRIDGALLELGRSCIHKDYRKTAVINLLWNGIAWQIKEHEVKYLFGCPRLDTLNPHEVNEAFALLRQKYYSQEEFRVYPLAKNTFSGLDESVVCVNQRKVFRSLSPLMKGYLHLGAIVCGQPAMDHEFDTVVFFMLLPTEKIASPYKRHFFGNEVQ